MRVTHEGVEAMEQKISRITKLLLAPFVVVYIGECG